MGKARLGISFDRRYHKGLRDGSFPKQVMMTTHPQRWTDDNVAWWKELILQNIKNAVTWLKLQIKS